MTLKEIIEGMEHCRKNQCKGCPGSKDLEGFECAEEVMYTGPLRYLKEYRELKKDLRTAAVPFRIDRDSKRWHCGACSTALGRFWVYCQKCGRKIDWENADVADVCGAGDLLYCGSCGSNIYYGLEVCPECGKKLNWDALEIRS